ncbi:DUF5119 domain-containing protein [uncultured Duncaniella sp.]|uniref:DUF5119 domain-containing protein n=1 Tax=uncultured Duncaniella sp. TaxID=2768039 RepID=UPI0025E21F7E|nr:DUF5119 domain-containing protein [uncultured Duncaniella sp.]
MRHLSHSMTVGLALISGILLHSCDHRELCFDHTHWTDLTVNFDWSAQPDATPKTMVLYLFPVDDSKPFRYEFSDINGSDIRVPAGEYNAAVFNGCTETIIESATTFDDFVLTTDVENILSPMSRNPLPEPPRYDAVKDEPVKAAPDIIWADKKEGISVKMTSGQSVRFTPTEATVTYMIKLTGVTNLTPSLGISGAISTMSENFSPAMKKHTGRNVTVPIALTMTAPSTIEGSVTLFGHCPTSEQQHIFTLYTSDKHYYNFNVTSQIHDAPDQRRITIVIDGIKLPGHNEGGGMFPSVSDWTEDVYLDVDMS